jgi:putative hydrolase of the HAD superfamily
MHDRAFDIIAFDADDTLWHNERSYRDARAQFQRLLTAAGVHLTDEEVEACVNRTEVANLEYFGYGVSSFALSLIETAIDVTGGRVPARDLRRLIDLARTMMTEEIELFASAREAVQELSASYRLMLVTKGDLLHQTSKLERSGLEKHFSVVEVVSHKTPRVYSNILSRHGIDPVRFLMVGNSLRSDVLPVVELGGWAVHVPAAISWSHEHAEIPDVLRARCFELPTLAELPTLINALEQVRTSTGGQEIRR